METGEKYFCGKCIAKKEEVGLVGSAEFCLKERYGKDWAYNTSLFKMGGRCAMCDVQDDKTHVVKHPQMEMFLRGVDGQ